MPRLDWIGKQYVVNHAEEVPFRLLRRVPEASVGEDSGNMVVHGDNLEALKALMPYYRERVKLVFIDPPYNTGNEGWSYNDRMNAPKIKQWFGKVVGGEGEDLSRHDKWLCMMYPRLELLRDLLADDGSIWITLDDNEVHYAKAMMDEIFGRNNFIASVIWQKVYAPKSSAKYFSDDHDYVLVYAKNAEVWRPNLLPRTEKQDKIYRNRDEDSRGPWRPDNLTARNPYSLGTYPITTPSGRVIPGPPRGSYWRVSKEKLEALDADERIWWGEDGNNVPALKRFLSEVKQGVVPQTIWSYEQAGHTQDAKKELVRLMDFRDTSDVFITPKPVKLLQRILQIATDRDSIVLDSFAGSGTTGHAVLKQNAEDGGDRRFVLVEMEDYADSLTAERVRRVIRGEDGQPTLGLEAGFDFYALGEDLFTKYGDEINPGVGREALSRFVLFLETGVADPSMSVNGTGYAGRGGGKDVYVFYEPEATTTFGHGSLAGLPPGEGERVVYADRCTVDPEALRANGVSFRKIPRDLQDLVANYNGGERQVKLFQSHPDEVELKDYQRRTLDELGDYVRRVSELRGVGAAIGDPAEVAFTVQTHQPWRGLTGNSGTPFVCVKVPTGGGKTLIAAHAAGLIYDEYLQDKDERGIVLWLTPSDTIRSQTLRALKDLGHPYRKVLQEGFNGPVHVMDNVEALRIRPDQVRDGLTVVVSTMQAMKRDNKEGLRFYADNGYLGPHFTSEDEREEVTFSLFEVIRRSKPLIIADEGHNAKTVLALDLIESLNPSFVLELTATPHEKSNVLVRVSALELKEEQMVKLPINVTNVSGWEEALARAVEKRGELEEASSKERQATGEYIRPMLLIQAEQEQENPDKVHVARIKDFLVREMEVPETQIRIKTGKQDQLGDADLMAEDVEVRYVITRDALREGWDAPSARYVLASVFNLGSPKAIEQLLGRILRLPYVREKGIQELNEGYVYTSAEQFGKVLKNIVNGMEENGYGRDEVRVTNGTPEPKYSRTLPARHEGLSIPLMAVNTDEGGRDLRYRQDLLGDDFSISDLDARVDHLNRADAEAGRLDLRDDQAFGWEMSQAPGYGGNGLVAGDPEDLVRWLLKKIGRYEEVADKDLLSYVRRVVEGLAEGHAPADLHRAKYQIRDQIKQNLDSHYGAWTRNRYEYLKSDGTLTAYDGVAYRVPPETRLPTSQCTTSYRKSVFEYPGKLNDEEADLANKLDRLDNLMCWYRNPDKDGFALQGYWRARFNPDLIAFTKSGRVAVLEYKGEDRVTNEDTKDKIGLGNDWAALDPEGRYFKLVTKANMQGVLKEVGEL